MGIADSLKTVYDERLLGTFVEPRKSRGELLDRGSDSDIDDYPS